MSYLGEDGSSNKDSSISLRAQDSISKAPSSVQSEASIPDGETEAEQDTAEVNQSEEAPATPSPPLSPVASDISEPQSSLVNQSQESAWREVTVSGGDWGNLILICYQAWYNVNQLTLKLNFIE